MTSGEGCQKPWGAERGTGLKAHHYNDREKVAGLKPHTYKGKQRNWRKMGKRAKRRVNGWNATKAWDRVAWVFITVKDYY